MDAIDARFQQFQQDNKDNKNTGLGKVAMDKDSNLTSAGLEILKVAASDAMKSKIVVQDEMMMAGLYVLVLTSKDYSLVKSALECIGHMAEHVICRGIMANSDLMDTLGGLIASHERDERHQDLAKKIKAKLDPHVKCSQSEHLHPFRDTKNIIPEERREQRNKKPAKRRSFFVGVNNSKSKTVTLYVRGMNDREDVELCRNRLLTVKGVISITFEPRLKRSVIRTKPDLKPELLAFAIRQTMTMSAEQVIKEEDGSESYVPFDFDETKQETDDMPDYPPDDSPIKGDNLLARNGQVEKEGGWGFIKSATNFLQNSFYW